MAHHVSGCICGGVYAVTTTHMHENSLYARRRSRQTKLKREMKHVLNIKADGDEETEVEHDEEADTCHLLYVYITCDMQ